RQRPQQRGIREREDGAVDADAECQRDRGHEGESRRRNQLPDGEPDVVAELLDESRQSHLAFSLSAQVHARAFELSEVANARQDDVARPFWIEAALDELARAQLDVQRELFIDLLVERDTPQPRTKGSLHSALNA